MICNVASILVAPYYQTMSIEPIERRINWTQLNAIEWLRFDCWTQSKLNRILDYPGFAVRLLNVIESIEYYGKFQFDWFDYVRLGKHSPDDVNRTRLNAKSQSNTIEYYPEIGRSIEIRLRSTIESQLFNRVRLRSIGSIAIFVQSRSIDIVWTINMTNFASIFHLSMASLTLLTCKMVKYGISVNIRRHSKRLRKIKTPRIIKSLTLPRTTILKVWKGFSNYWLENVRLSFKFDKNHWCISYNDQVTKTSSRLEYRCL